MQAQPYFCASLLVCSGARQAQGLPMPAAALDDGNGAYLSAVYGDGQIEGGNTSDDGQMHGHTLGGCAPCTVRAP